jgi:hypothetical protein
MTAPRFAILLHNHPAGDHWDLLLEAGEMLAAWRLLADPLAGNAGAIPAQKLPDHRMIYLTYEGPISGNRGSVRRVEDGSYELLDRDGDCWRVALKGRLLHGEFVIGPDAGDAVTKFRPAQSSGR